VKSDGSGIAEVNRAPVRRKIRKRSFRTLLKSQHVERKTFSTKNSKR